MHNLKLSLRSPRSENIQQKVSLFFSQNYSTLTYIRYQIICQIYRVYFINHNPFYAQPKGVSTPYCKVFIYAGSLTVFVIKCNYFVKSVKFIIQEITYRNYYCQFELQSVVVKEVGTIKLIV